MNTSLVTMALLALALTLTSGQLLRGGRGRAARRGAQAGAISESSLKAGDRKADRLAAKLQRKQARQEKLDARAAVQERRREKAALATGDRLAAANSVDFETVDNAVQFNNLDATAGRDISDKFALQLFTDNKFKEGAKIDESNGRKFNEGTRFSSDTFLDTERFDRAEAISENEFLDAEQLSAGNAAEDLLNVQEAAKVESEAFINSQDLAQIQGAGQAQIGGQIGGQRGGIFGNGVFGSSPFGSFGFKKR